MAGRPVEPIEVAQMVESFASDQFRNAAKFSNSEVLDDSGMFTLHDLAAQIYAMGFNQGGAVEDARRRGQRERDQRPNPTTLTEGTP